MLKRFVFILIISLLATTHIQGQSDRQRELQSRLENYFENYEPKSGLYLVRAKLKSVRADDENRILTVTATDQFSE